MRTTRWFNQSLPQTLQTAVFLLYINAAIGVLFGTFFFVYGPLVGVAGLLAYLLAGLGIASEQKWGYLLGVAVAVAAVGTIFYYYGGVSEGLSGGLIPLLFDGALVALLLHPMSRNHQRVWFS
jgi:hypothetical protein